MAAPLREIDVRGRPTTNSRHKSSVEVINAACSSSLATTRPLKLSGRLHTFPIATTHRFRRGSDFVCVSGMRSIGWLEIVSLNFRN